MRKIKRIRLKAPAIRILKFLGFCFCVFLVLFIFYKHEISQLTKIGYSNEASNYILFHGKKKYILSVGENKTLNAAFESEYYKEEYFDKYQHIKYVKHKDIIKNINTLIEKGYSTSNINMIMSHGSNEDVAEFAKRDKVRYLEEFYTLSYAKLKYYDRYIAYSDETGEDDEATVLIVNMDLDKEDYVDARDVTTFSIDMLVNKHRKLGEDFVPDDLVKISKTYASSDKLEANREAYAAFIKMSKAAETEGYGIYINSAYRSYQDQVDLCEYYKSVYGENYVLKYVAQPGYSEHQTGLGFDIASTSNNVFLNSKEYVWMQDNAYKYGFIMRFPSKYVSITGFNYEPWHFRYVGVDIATYMHDNNMPYEKYFAMFLDN
ncbi:MAG: M15 family metallopeptidase [Bacilli bacterium]|nr:M15 family metallopeptidase [Bacilli bacterium]